MRPPHRRALLALAVVALPSAAPAQDLGVHASALVPRRHALLDDTMAGGGGDLRVRTPVARLGVRLAADFVRARATRTGIACAGLIQPGTCAPETLRDDARATAGTAGVVVRVLGDRRLGVSVTADAALAVVRVRTRGLASGNALSAGKRLWGGLGGLEAAWAPIAGRPLVLEAAGALGRLTPARREVVLDGYTPLEEGFGVASLRLGLAWRPARR